MVCSVRMAHALWIRVHSHLVVNSACSGLSSYRYCLGSPQPRYQAPYCHAHHTHHARTCLTSNFGSWCTLTQSVFGCTPLEGIDSADKVAHPLLIGHDTLLALTRLRYKSPLFRRRPLNLFHLTFLNGKPCLNQ